MSENPEGKRQELKRSRSEDLSGSAEEHLDSDSDGDVSFKRKKRLHKVEDDLDILHQDKMKDSGNFTVLPDPVTSMMSQIPRF